MMTPDGRARIAKANRGRLVSAQTLAKMSAANKGRIPWNKGKHMSPQAIAKMSAATRLWWKKRKGTIRSNIVRG